jgi:hypothetical protein
VIIVQGGLKRSLSFWHAFGIATIAVAIDAVVMHSHLFVLGFDVPEGAEYFIAKFLVVGLVSIAVIAKYGYKLKVGLLAAILGSSIFSIYYLITRPSIIGPGLYPSAEYQVYDIQTSVIIWITHALAVFIGFVILMRLMKK